jgi:hypothetical protein
VGSQALEKKFILWPPTKYSRLAFLKKENPNDAEFLVCSRFKLTSIKHKVNNMSTQFAIIVREN